MPCFLFRGIIKNKPALGERALQELIQDNLLKLNYFLVDSRGRVNRSYMKVPPPSIGDPAREEFIDKMLRHGIGVEEYCLIYERCSIPPNNKLSNFTLDIFEKSSSFVNQYSKYRQILENVIQKHVANSNIHETYSGTFVVQNQNAFTLHFDQIDNLTMGRRPEQTGNQNQSTTILNHITPLLSSTGRGNAGLSQSATNRQHMILSQSPPTTINGPNQPSPPMANNQMSLLKTTMRQSTAPAKLNPFKSVTEKISAMQHHYYADPLNNEQNTNIIGK